MWCANRSPSGQVIPTQQHPLVLLILIAQFQVWHHWDLRLYHQPVAVWQIALQSITFPLSPPTTGWQFTSNYTNSLHLGSIKPHFLSLQGAKPQRSCGSALPGAEEHSVWELDMTWEKGKWWSFWDVKYQTVVPTQETVFDLTTVLDNVDAVKLVCGRKLKRFPLCFLKIQKQKGVFVVKNCPKRLL